MSISRRKPSHMSRSAGSTSGAGGLSPDSTYRCRRSALLSFSTRPTESRTCGDTEMSRPCSSHWYQDAPTPASTATSSRRSPGVRRRAPPSGRPASAGLTRARRLIRNSRSSRSRCALPARCLDDLRHVPDSPIRSAWWCHHQHNLRLPTPIPTPRSLLPMAIDTHPTPGTTHTPAPLDNPPGCPTRDKLVLFVLCAAQFVVALDFSVLNVALPVLGDDLGMSRSALQWAVTAFALPSGGFLLLFGRIGDLYGRRKLFLAGLALFGAASLLATFAWDPASFLAGRALQGLGAATIVPTGMSLLTTTFPEGRPGSGAGDLRDAALARLHRRHGGGGALTDTWAGAPRWACFLFSVVVLALAPGLLEESRTTDRPRLDVPARSRSPSGLLALIYALTTAAEHGFGGVDVLITLVLGVLLLAAFVAWSPVRRHPWSRCRCCAGDGGVGQPGRAGDLLDDVGPSSSC